jgi:hypothetical protein
MRITVDLKQVVITASTLVGALTALVSVGIPIFEHTRSTQLVLPPFISDWIGGGHSPDEVCAPQRQQYEKKYPEYDISVRHFEATTKDLTGHTSYQYRCSFAAMPKSAQESHTP